MNTIRIASNESLDNYSSGEIELNIGRFRKMFAAEQERNAKLEADNAKLLADNLTLQRLVQLQRDEAKILNERLSKLSKRFGHALQSNKSLESKLQKCLIAQNKSLEERLEKLEAKV